MAWTKLIAPGTAIRVAVRLNLSSLVILLTCPNASQELLRLSAVWLLGSFRVPWLLRWGTNRPIPDRIVGEVF